MKSEITQKGHSKILYEAHNSDMRMAPHSNFYYGINLGNHRLKSGNYTMKITGVADGNKFSFDKDFSISQKEAKNIIEALMHGRESGLRRKQQVFMIPPR